MEEEKPDRCYLSLSNKYINTPRIYKPDYNHTKKPVIVTISTTRLTEDNI